MIDEEVYNILILQKKSNWEAILTLENKQNHFLLIGNHFDSLL